MNREIKFRAWQRYHERMLKVTGFQFGQDGNLESVSTFRENQTPRSIIYSKFNNNFNLYIDEAPTLVLMQCTGLKDKNGTEVYINDIVEDEYGRRYEIVFEGDCLRCNGVRRKKGGHKPKNRWFGKGLKVIGNRYENPELLKEE